MFGAKLTNALKLISPTTATSFPYFGAVDYHTGEFLIQAYPKGNSDHTIEFLQYLLAQSPGQRLLIIWDGATYHRSEQMQQYLEQVNAGKVIAIFK